MEFYTKYKTFIILGLVSGLVFALIMAGWDSYKEQPFSALKFGLHFVFFGAFNGYMSYRKHKKINS